MPQPITLTDADEVANIVVRQKGEAVLDRPSDELYVLWKECLAAAKLDATAQTIDLSGVYLRFQEAITKMYGCSLSLFAVTQIAANVIEQMNELKKNWSIEQELPASDSTGTASPTPNA